MSKHPALFRHVDQGAEDGKKMCECMCVCVLGRGGSFPFCSPVMIIGSSVLLFNHWTAVMFTLFALRRACYMKHIGAGNAIMQMDA